MSTSFNQMGGSTRASSSGSNNNNNFTLAMEGGHMFDKVLTPSDVGKLNRLVVPKVHAEAYFPLEDNKNDATLDFLDPTGKTWRFRYSYWNSSQSYVMTKGWNRFIKDKTLQHGDIVSFRRCFVPDDNDPEKHRTIMLIDWKKKSDIQLGNSRPYPIYGSQASSLLLLPMGGYYPIPHYRSFQPLYDNQFQERELFGNGYGRFVNGGHYYGGVRNPTLEVGRETSLDYNHLGRSEPLVFASFPVFPRGRVAPSGQPLQAREGVAPTKKLRLFGVDMEESSSSGETMGYSFASPHGEMGASSSLVMQLSDEEEEYKRKGKSFIY